jgi:hypothetical protein
MIGEYLARVSDEVVGRPYFVVREELGAKPAPAAPDTSRPAAGS